MSVRREIQHQVHQLVGLGGEVDLDRGDAGLFGPGSAAWRVHADFTAMMIGGVSSLLLQMLHPGALGGVWDHSNFRKDMQGRLRRTAQFISGTTYGSREQAERLIDRVRTIHDHVQGTLPDGTIYSANDPALLTWVHVAEVRSFLAAHLRYRGDAFSPAAQDRYYAEMAVIARRLGAMNVPVSRKEIEAYIREVRPALRSDGRTREVAAALLGQPAPTMLAGPFRDVTIEAGIDLLPRWAADMHGLSVGPVRRHMVRAGAQGIGAILRWALNDGSARRAHRRVGVRGGTVTPREG
jgi:uncharacterized protein (DUF2236 family)